MGQNEQRTLRSIALEACNQVGPRRVECEGLGPYAFRFEHTTEVLDGSGFISRACINLDETAVVVENLGFLLGPIDLRLCPDRK